MKHKHILFVLAFCMLSVATISIAYAWVNPTLNPPGGGGAIRVAPGGNVGIGTTAPGSNLTVRRATAGTAFAIRNTADTANTFTISDAGVAHMTGFQLGTTATAGHVLTASATGVGTWAAVTGLPTGTTGQTIRHDGTNWISNSFLSNTGSRIGIGTASPAARLSVVGEGATSATQALNITNSAGVSSLFVRDDGNVGIGTTAPWARLDVVGPIAGSGITIRSSGDVVLGTGGSLFFDGNYSYATGNYIRPLAANTQAFFTSGAERMRLTADGNVGIGTTTPAERLDVVGNVRANAFFTVSDQALKKEVKPLQNSLEKILGIRGVSFRLKANNEPSIGVIAQNVEQLFPEMVRISQISGEKSVDYGKLVAPLIEAIREQQKQIQYQQTQINELKDEIGKLR